MIKDYDTALILTGKNNCKEYQIETKGNALDLMKLLARFMLKDKKNNPYIVCAAAEAYKKDHPDPLAYLKNKKTSSPL